LLHNIQKIVNWEQGRVSKVQGNTAMHNQFKTTSLTGTAAAATLLRSRQAWALGGNQPFALTNNWAITCRTLTLVVSGNSTGYVTIGSNNATPGGTRYVGGASSSTTPPTSSYLETNCGLSLVQDFFATRTQTSYASDSYYGVSFRATDDVTGLNFRQPFRCSDQTIEHSATMGRAIVRVCH
jgi:hypothetical protein